MDDWKRRGAEAPLALNNVWVLRFGLRRYLLRGHLQRIGAERDTDQLVLQSDGGKVGNTDFAELLSSIEGVGEAKVLISESGVVVVCKGAANAAVRLNVTNAVRSYTGFSTEKITILKMTEQ